MRLPIFQIDAFALRPFEGNPAAVVPLPHWLDDRTLQAIAQENNLSETVFFVPEEEGYRIRWFTPVTEMDLCGHATLAAAHVILREPEGALSRVDFRSQSGPLTVTREGDRLVLDFPSRPPRPIPVPEGLEAALGAPILECHLHRDLFAVLADETSVRDLRPDLGALCAFEQTSVVVTAQGRSCDVVSRCFAPREGISEDPVTGSTHCSLVPFWAARLRRETLHCRQLSARSGELHCRLVGDRVRIAGQTIKVLEGTLFL